MPIKDYSEKQIREKIINKLQPEIKKGRSAHDKGLIKLNGKVQLRVKLPNSHAKKIMKHSRSQLIASALKLDDEQFCDLIDCPLKGPEYYRLLGSILRQ
jgi:hypothetical protein